jgi:phosphatidylglycerol---prolipoprotein diacylglyceryl transferase
MWDQGWTMVKEDVAGDDNLCGSLRLGLGHAGVSNSMSVYALCLTGAAVIGWLRWTSSAVSRGWITTPWLSPASLFFVVGILGARALATFGEWDRYSNELFAPSGPLAIQGAMIAFFISSWAFARLRGLPPAECLDLAASTFACMIVPIRLGCFAAGCCFGTPTEVPWAVVHAVHGSVHPAQIYEVVLGIAIVTLLFVQERRRARPGFRFATFLVAYGIGRALIERLRDDTPRDYVGMSYPQVVALAMAIVGIVHALALQRRSIGSVAVSTESSFDSRRSGLGRPARS